MRTSPTTWTISLFVTLRSGTRLDAEHVVEQLTATAERAGATLDACEIDNEQPSPPPNPWVSLLHLHEWYFGANN